MTRFKYPALCTRQTSSEKLLVFFSPPSTEVNLWAGVPQKKRFDEGEETAGFQREENASRIASLRDFYRNQENLIQNPLLCATRGTHYSKVFFEPDSTGSNQSTTQGHIIIEVPDFDRLSMGTILGEVRNHLEDRVPELGGRKPNKKLVARLKNRARIAGHLDDGLGADEVDEDFGDSSEQVAEESISAESVLFDESHIIDFWDEVAARHEISKQIEDDLPHDSFLGFGRNALLAYLRPVVLVDGQHRLRGALEAAQSRLDDESIHEEIEKRIEDGESAAEIRQNIMSREARSLPVSLLMSDDPSEQVFQFVVVNQKATPIGRALLGTIVSTTLSNDEMGRVAGRLKDAGIRLEESQAVTYLARHQDSPFCGLIERGLSGKSNDLLQWNVFASLIGIFRHLKGGRLYGQRNDYANLWANRYLGESGIVKDFRDKGFDSPDGYWSSLEGPWRQFFISFWRTVRDELGNTSVPDKPNYWGATRESNLFNKISLTILAADFFQFLVETRTKIESVDNVPDLTRNWLQEVNRGYFDRSWNLGGVKKDSTGIRNRWAEIWTEYRKSGGSLPDKRNFRSPKGE